MIKMKYIVTFLIGFLYVLSADSLDFITSNVVGPGVTHHHEYKNEGPWNIHILEIDLSDSLIHLETVKAEDSIIGNERTSNMSDRRNYEGHRVIGAINGDFYGVNGIPIGAQIIQGTVLKTPYSRSIFAMDVNKQPYIDILDFIGHLFATNGTDIEITDVNTDRLSDNLIIYNSFYGSTTQTNHWGTEIIAHYIDNGMDVNTPRIFVVANKDSIMAEGHGNNTIPNNGLILSGHGISAEYLNDHIFVGDTLMYNLEMLPIVEPLQEMIGGMPRLIRNSTATVEWDEEGTSYSFAHDRHPRSAIGFNQDSSRVFFFTVDGRQPGYSIGMSLFELADYMLEWEVSQGLNLDGGGSTTMVVRGNVINSPSDNNGERAVSNALMVISRAPTSDISILRVSPEIVNLEPDTQEQFTINGFDQYFNPINIMGDSVIWTCTQEIGLIDSSGIFTSGSLVGTGHVWATYQTIVGTSTVYVDDFMNADEIDREENLVTKEFSLKQNFPNPFNPSTTIHFSIHNDSNLSLKVFNVYGQEVATLLDKHVIAGSYHIIWNGQDHSGKQLGSGMYFAQLESESFLAVNKMVLLK
jgi:hypothetical protein